MKNLIRRSFLPVLERTGVPRFGELRHSAATLLLGRGVHPTVAVMLGHSRISATLDLYSPVRRAVQWWWTEAMDAILTS